MSKHTLQDKLNRVSRNCGFTQEVNKILCEKLSDYEIMVFERWLEVVSQQKQIDINNEKNGFRKYY
jgi:hypothetical protein